MVTTAPRPLSPKAERVLIALMRRVVPVGELVPEPTEEGHAVTTLRRILAGFSPGALVGFRVALFLFQMSPIVWLAGFGRFSRLSPERQDRYIERWMESRRYLPRAMLKMLTAVVMMAAYSDPVVQARLGYDRERLEAALNPDLVAFVGHGGVPPAATWRASR